MATSTGSGPRPGCGGGRYAGAGEEAEGEEGDGNEVAGVEAGDADAPPPLEVGVRIGDAADVVDGGGGVVDAACVTVRPDVGVLAGGPAAAPAVFAAAAGGPAAGAAEPVGGTACAAGLVETGDGDFPPEPVAEDGACGAGETGPVGDALPPAGTLAGDAAPEFDGLTVADPGAAVPADGPEAGLPDIGPPDTKPPEFATVAPGPVGPGPAESGAAAPEDPGGFPPLAEEPELGGGVFGVMGAGPTARLDLDV